MIAGRDGDHAALFRFIGQGLNLVGGAANLEGAGALQVFALEPNLVSGDLVEGAGSHDGRAMNASSDARLCFSDKI